jgi:ankyrin repeat protein
MPRTTALHFAAENSLEVTKLLIEIGEASLQVKSKLAGSAFHHAVKSGKSDIAVYLLGELMMFSVHDKGVLGGYTALYLAASLKHPQIFPMILSRGAKVDCVSRC